MRWLTMCVCLDVVSDEQVAESFLQGKDDGYQHRGCSGNHLFGDPGSQHSQNVVVTFGLERFDQQFVRLLQLQCVCLELVLWYSHTELCTQPHKDRVVFQLVVHS